MKRAAAIDVGSGSVKLYVGERTESGVRPILARNAMTRLGEGLRETGRLSQAAMERTAAAVAEFAQAARRAGAEQIACVGTMALREAENSREFARMARERCGLECRVLPGEEEARLCFAAACAGDAGECLVMDSGGGSTELALGSGGVPQARTSIPVGAVNVTERFFAGGATAERIAQARAYIRKEIAARAPEVPAHTRMIATGGTATTMAAVMKALSPYDPEKIRDAFVSREEAERQLALYAGMSAAERAKLPGMQAGREDVILGGACIAAEAADFCSVPGMIVRDCGLRHALVWEMLIKDEQ